MVDGSGSVQAFIYRFTPETAPGRQTAAGADDSDHGRAAANSLHRAANATAHESLMSDEIDSAAASQAQLRDVEEDCMTDQDVFTTATVDK
jgi:hypothetical protein